MGRYRKAYDAKFEVESRSDSDRMWLLFDDNDDKGELVVGKLDSQPIVWGMLFSLAFRAAAEVSRKLTRNRN